MDLIEVKSLNELAPPPSVSRIHVHHQVALKLLMGPIASADSVGGASVLDPVFEFSGNKIEPVKEKMTQISNNE